MLLLISIAYVQFVRDWSYWLYWCTGRVHSFALLVVSNARTPFNYIKLVVSNALIPFNYVQFVPDWLYAKALQSYQVEPGLTDAELEEDMGAVEAARETYVTTSSGLYGNMLCSYSL